MHCCTERHFTSVLYDGIIWTTEKKVFRSAARHGFGSAGPEVFTDAQERHCGATDARGAPEKQFEASEHKKSVSECITK